MALQNPYLDLFLALPSRARRDPSTPVLAIEALAPDWLTFKAAMGRCFAWAVPTEAAIQAIARHAPAGVVEVGAGSGYWAWLLRQAGVAVTAYDLDPPPFTWSAVERGGDDRAAAHPDAALFLCWPPWGVGMATRALAAYGGGCVIYVGEWMGGAAEPAFFARLASGFDCVEVVDIPQWWMRDDRLMIFRRRGGAVQSEDPRVEPEGARDPRLTSCRPPRA